MGFTRNGNTTIQKKHTLYLTEVHCIYFRIVKAQADEKNHEIKPQEGALVNL